MGGEMVVQKFPEVRCWGEHAPMAFTAISMVILFACVAYCIASGIHWEPTSIRHDYLSEYDSCFNVRWFGYKTVVTVCSVILSTYPLAQAIILFCTTWFMLHSFYRFMPYYNLELLKLRFGLISILAWISTCLLWAVFREADAHESNAPMFVAVLGALPCFLSAKHVIAMRCAGFDRRLQRAEEFQDVDDKLDLELVFAHPFEVQLYTKRIEF